MFLKFINLIKKQNGVTFIELIIVLSIFSIVAGITLFNFTGFSTSISVENLAHDIALGLNESQKLAIYGKNTQGIIPAYGLHFERGQISTLDSAKQFVSFSDSNAGSTSIVYTGDFAYDNSASITSACDGKGTDECLKIYTIQNGSIVSDLCVTDANGTDECLGTNTGTLDISFKRPFPDAHIVAPWYTGAKDSISGASIQVLSAKGIKRVIHISKVGQTTVKAVVN